MIRITVFLLLCAILAAPALGDFTVEDVETDLDEISIIVFPLIVSPEEFENAEGKTGAFHDDPEDPIATCVAAFMMDTPNIPRGDA